MDVPEYTRHDSAGNELKYQIGINGSCSHLSPPAGYWCSAHPNRTVDGSLTHRWPSGLNFSTHLKSYKNATGAIVHSCRGGANCWFTWMFQVDGQTDDTLTWNNGGFQGAEEAMGVELGTLRTFLRLDWPNEYF